MQERIIEIIEYIVSEISKPTGVQPPDFKSLSRVLLEKGYTEKEIRKAIQWVKTHYHGGGVKQTEAPKALPRAYRFLSREERKIFTPEAYGYLLQLQMLGVLTPLLVEEILEQSFLVGMGEVDFPLIRKIVAQVLMGKDAQNLETDAVIFPGNDKIN